jgi:hypothetical protein
MSSEPLFYATGTHRSPPRLRRVLRKLPRYGALAVLVAIPIAVAVVSYRWPWVWYGSRNSYQWHRWLTFTIPADQVVYEEDPDRAAKLLALPADPDKAYVGGEKFWLRNPLRDYQRAGVNRSGAAYSPPAFRALDQFGEPALVLLHERAGPTAHHRLVVISPGCEFSEYSPSNPQRRVGVWLSANAHPIRQPYDVFRAGSGIFIPLHPDEIMRIYAGQADPKDDAHFTIKYEIDNVPGTIDGRLEADDTVTLKVRDGPAKALATSQPSSK